MADEHTHEHEHDHDHDHEHDHGDHDHEHDHDQDESEERARPRSRREREHVRRHALAQIRQYPDVALRMKAHEVTEFDDYLVQLVERMIAPDGGRAGRRARRDAGRHPAAAVRLRAEARRGRGRSSTRGSSTLSGEKETDEEGCLSLEGVRVPVERSTKVTLEGKDPSGEDVRCELEGLGARVVQHELDHLDGVLIIDRTDAEHRKEALGTLRPQTVLR